MDILLCTWEKKTEFLYSFDICFSSRLERSCFICTGIGRKHTLHLLLQVFSLSYCRLHNAYFFIFFSAPSQAGNRNISSKFMTCYQHRRAFRGPGFQWPPQNIFPSIRDDGAHKEVQSSSA